MWLIPTQWTPSCLHWWPEWACKAGRGMLKSARQPQVIWLALLCAWLQELQCQRHHWEEEIGDRKTVACGGCARRTWRERNAGLKQSPENETFSLIGLSDENDYPALTEPWPNPTVASPPEKVGFSWTMRLVKFSTTLWLDLISAPLTHFPSSSLVLLWFLWIGASHSDHLPRLHRRRESGVPDSVPDLSETMALTSAEEELESLNKAIFCLLSCPACSWGSLPLTAATIKLIKMLKAIIQKGKKHSNNGWRHAIYFIWTFEFDIVYCLPRGHQLVNDGCIVRQKSWQMITIYCM